MITRGSSLNFSPLELRRGTTFAVFFWMLAIAAVLGHRAFAPLLLAPLAAIDWKHAWYARRATFRALDGAWMVYFVSAGVFCTYAALSAFWSPLPEKAAWSWKFAACFLIAPMALHSVSYLAPAARARAGAGVAWACLAMAALLSFEALTGAKIRQALPPYEIAVRDVISLGRGALLLTLLVWPAMRIFDEHFNRPLLGWGVAALAVIPALLLTIETNALMLAVGFVAYGAGRIAGRRAAVFFFAVFGALVWLAPLAAIALPLEAWGEALKGAAPDSWVQRLFIWARAGDEIAAHPFGGGVGYARYLSRPIIPVEISGVELNTMPLHPHNMILHVWMELGVVGAAALSGLVFAASRMAARAAVTKADAGMIAAIIAAITVTTMTEWSLWQVWRFAAVWIALIACRLALDPRKA